MVGITLMIGIAIYAVLFSFSETGNIIDGNSSAVRCLAGFLYGVAAAKITFRILPDPVQLALVALLIVAISLNFQIPALCLMFLVCITTAQNSGILAKVSKMSIPYLIGGSSFSIYLAHVPVGMVISTLAYKLES